MVPVMLRFTLIQTLSERSPSALARAGPETRTCFPSDPPVPVTVTAMILPDLLRLTDPNPLTVPTW
jgi:hypothetical protein